MKIEIDTTNKKITIKEDVKISDLMLVLYELNIEDYEIHQEIEYIQYPSYPVYPIYPNYPIVTYDGTGVPVIPCGTTITTGECDMTKLDTTYKENLNYTTWGYYEVLGQIV